MDGGGFIADMIARARYNRNLRRGNQFFKKSNSSELLSKKKKTKDSKLIEESKTKFYNHARYRRSPERMASCVGLVAVGFVLVLIAAFLLALISDFFS